MTTAPDIKVTVLDRWKWAYQAGEQHGLSTVERAVLVRNAYHADVSFESASTIAKVVGCKRQAVNAAHKKLELLGLIAVDKVNGRTNKRRIVAKPGHSGVTSPVEATDLDAQVSGVDAQVSGVDAQVSGGGRSGVTNSYLNLETNLDINDDARSDAAPDDDEEEVVIVIPEPEPRTKAAVGVIERQKTVMDKWRESGSKLSYVDWLRDRRSQNGSA